MIKSAETPSLGLSAQGLPVPSATVLLVGCGKMGRAMLGGWLAEGLRPESIFVVDPAAADLPAGVHRAPTLEALPAEMRPDVIVLAVKPQMMTEAAAPLVRWATGDDVVIFSVAAGKTIAFYRALLGESVRVVRAMPNTPAAVGRGMTVLCAGPGVTTAHKALCQSLASGVGEVAWIEDEGLMDAVTAVSGSGPAYVFHLVEALADAGEALGLSADLAMLLARQTVAGAGELLFGSTESAAQLRKNVTSPGGTTAAALEVLMDADDGMRDLMTRAAAAAARRSRELAG